MNTPSPAPPSTPSRRYDAVILDLDGVITRTARVHARAWKQLFDEFLQARAEENEEPCVPFALDRDYRRYVDGKPRYDGVASFLASRGIELPRGDPSDPPDAKTVCGLGNRKDRYFNAALERDGVEVFEGTEAFLAQVDAAGLPSAVVSSSRNCRPVLRRAGMLERFATVVDGTDSAELDLDGKPAPDIFLTAAERLEVSPRRAVVVEDAVSGVQAGAAGDFGCVVGVDRIGKPRALLENGADLVVSDLGELTDLAALPAPATSTHRLPSALERVAEIEDRAAGRRLAVFLDYDGTMTPIVERPEDAVLSDETRAAVRHLAARTPVAIVSGRDRQDVESLVGLEDLIYAGSHGFDIRGPHGEAMEFQLGEDYRPSLDAAAEELERRLADVPGARLERKRFALAVHFRQTPPERHDEVDRIVGDVHARHDDLRQSGGKMIHELRPDMEWDKGRAVLWLLEKLGLDGPDVLPMYVGDDLTDEDAFRALRRGDRGLGVVVRDGESRRTAAHYALESPAELSRFLDRLATEEGTS